MSSATASRPESPSSKTIQQTGFKPADLDPDLQTLAMVDNMRKELDSPSEISKPFAVRKALYTALTHTENNPTGYDASLRLAVFSSYEKSSLNIVAKFFNSFMAFLMKPKMIIQGIPQAQQQAEEPGFLSRMLMRLRGQEPQAAEAKPK